DRVLQHTVFVQVLDQCGQNAVGLRQQAPLETLEVVLVRVPAADRDGNEADAGLDQTACGQHALAGSAGAVGLAEGLRLLVQVERLLGLVRAKNLQGLLVEGIEPFGQVGSLIQRLEVVVKGLEQLVAILQLFEGEPSGQSDTADAQCACGAFAVGS